MVFRPVKRIDLRKIRLAEKTEVQPAGFFAPGIFDRRQLSDVASGKRLLHQRLTRRITTLGIGAHSARSRHCLVELVDEPRAIFTDVDAPAVLITRDPKPALLKMPVNLRGADYCTGGCRIDDFDEFGRFQVRELNLRLIPHDLAPLKSTRCSSRY